MFDDRSEISIAKLHKTTTELLPFYFNMVENKSLKEYWEAKNKDKTSSNLDEIVQLALKGMLKNVFIKENMNLWGRINYQTGECHYYKKQMDSVDDDILDDIAEIVLWHGGSVTVLPAHRMPDSLAAAAIIRNYPRESGLSIAV
jgi:hypothetical protein